MKPWKSQNQTRFNQWDFRENKSKISKSKPDPSFFRSDHKVKTLKSNDRIRSMNLIETEDRRKREKKEEEPEGNESSEPRHCRLGLRWRRVWGGYLRPRTWDGHRRTIATTSFFFFSGEIVSSSSSLSLSRFWMLLLLLLLRALVCRLGKPLSFKLITRFRLFLI